MQAGSSSRSRPDSASANKHAAFELLNFMLTNVAGDARYITETAYAVPNTVALPQVPKAVANILHTNPALQGKVFITNDAWWATNLKATTQRLKAWRLAA